MKFASGHSDSLETVAFAPDGSVVVGGFVGAAHPAKGATFKSGGQVEEGYPFVAKLSAAKLASSEPPDEYDWFYYETDRSAYYGSVKAVRVDNNGDIYAIAGGKTGAIKFDKDGNVLAKSGKVPEKYDT